MKISIAPFKGQTPKVTPVMLPNEVAQISSNTNLELGGLKGFRKPLIVSTCVNTGVKSFFKYVEDSTEHWVDSSNILNAVRSPISQDAFERMYFTGMTQPRYFSNDKISSPFDPTTDYLKMGIPTPASAPTFVSGHTGGSAYRAYVYTYVNRFGVEGPPSAVLETLTYLSGNVVLGGFTAPTSGHACITAVSSNHPHVRIYRTNSATSGVAAFQFVKEQNIDGSTNWSALQITDDVTDANLGEVIPSVGWYKPNASMVGLIGLSNGIFVGFYGNTLCFSEPFLPDAWPTAYEISFSEQIIGIGFFGTNVVVCTDENPYLVYGSHPSNMAKKRLAGFFPCSSRQGIVSTEIGVHYPCPFGIVLIDGNGARNITERILTKEDMTKLKPSLWRAGYYNNSYIAFYYDIATNYGGIHFNENDGIFSVLNIYRGATYLDYTDSKFYVAGVYNPSYSTEYIQEWEGDSYNYLQYKWKSKRFLLPESTNLSTARVIIDTDFYNSIIELIENEDYLADLNATLFAGDIEGTLNSCEINSIAINDDILFSLNDVTITPYVTFKLYVNSVLRFTKQLENSRAFRLPSGFRGRNWEVQLEGFVQVNEVSLASSMEEMMNG